jgi:transposase
LSEYEGLPRPEATAKSHGIEVPRMDKRTTVGIDLAKDVFAICVLDAHGAVLDRKVPRRAALERWAESLSELCTVAMEACGSAHHWD